MGGITKSMENSIKIRDSFIVNALRNCGYTPYSAIADIIDNSIEKDVESKNVWVRFLTHKDKTSTMIDTVLIIDDGNGMDADTLKEAMCLGSETGKDPEMDLGMYGTGMKSSALSMGQTFTIFSKARGSDVLLSTYMSVKSYYDGSEEKKAISLDEPIKYPLDTEEYTRFKNYTGADHGTVVIITDLDKFPKTYLSVKNTTKKEIGKTFNKFILNGGITFHVDNDEVLPVNPMGECNELLGSGTIEVGGREISYNAYFVKSTKIEDDTLESDNDYSNTAVNKQGFYIYRNDRMVGEHLSLHYVRHPEFRNFRCELFVDGTCDELFGSTFTKIINEYNRSSINQELKDKLAKATGPYLQECRSRSKKLKAEKRLDPEVKRQTEEFYKGVTEKQNKNRFLKGTRKGINVKHEEIEKEEKEHTIRGKQKNPNPIKVRKDIWLGGFDEQPLGRRGNIVEFQIKDSRPWILINTEHPFYSEFYSNLPNEMKAKLAQAISCIEIAKQDANYYTDIGVQNSVDEFLLVFSNEVAKSLER